MPATRPSVQRVGRRLAFRISFVPTRGEVPRGSPPGGTIAEIKQDFAWDLGSCQAQNYSLIGESIRGTATPRALTKLGTGLSETGYTVIVLSDDLVERQGGCQ